LYALLDGPTDLTGTGYESARPGAGVGEIFTT
jgi:hypothetical protein